LTLLTALTARDCRTAMHVAHRVALRRPGEDHTKDIDFTAGGIELRRQAGHADTPPRWTCCAVRPGRRRPIRWTVSSSPTEGSHAHACAGSPRSRAQCEDLPWRVQVPRERLGPVFGHASDATMLAVNRALAVFLGLA